MPRNRSPFHSGIEMPFPFPLERTAPHAIGPFIFPPEGRKMSIQERYHEGYHAQNPLASEEETYGAETGTFPPETYANRDDYNAARYQSGLPIETRAEQLARTAPMSPIPSDELVATILGEGGPAPSSLPPLPPTARPPASPRPAPISTLPVQPGFDTTDPSNPLNDEANLPLPELPTDPRFDPRNPSNPFNTLLAPETNITAPIPNTYMTQPTVEPPLPGMNASTLDPFGGNTGVEALDNVFGGLDPRGQYVSLPEHLGITPEAAARRDAAMAQQPAAPSAPVKPVQPSRNTQPVGNGPTSGPTTGPPRVGGPVPGASDQGFKPPTGPVPPVPTRTTQPTGSPTPAYQPPPPSAGGPLAGTATGLDRVATGAGPMLKNRFIDIL